jgi:hypothetical protein
MADPKIDIFGWFLLSSIYLLSRPRRAEPSTEIYFEETGEPHIESFRFGNPSIYTKNGEHNETD